MSGNGCRNITSGHAAEDIFRECQAALRVVFGVVSLDPAEADNKPGVEAAELLDLLQEDDSEIGMVEAERVEVCALKSP